MSPTLPRSRAAPLLLALLLVAPAMAGAASPRDDRSQAGAVAPDLEERLQAGGSHEVIVTLSEEAGPGATADLEEAGLAVLRSTEVLPFVLARGPAEAVRAAADLEAVDHVAPNERIHFALETATDATRAEDSHDPDPPAQAVRQTDPVTGDGVGVAVVDSGIDATHPDLAWHEKTLRNWKRVTLGTANQVPDAVAWKDVPDSDAASGHGTHVAGIVGGTGAASDGTVVGAAPGVSLYGFGVGAGVSIFAPIEAFDFILRHQGDEDVFPVPVEVVTNSWGSCGDYNPADPIVRATDDLVDAGITVVYAAGNQGPTCPTHVTKQAQIPTPGVISVANYDDQDTGTRSGSIAPSSSVGYEDDRSTWPDVAAPGTDIRSTAASGQGSSGAHGYTEMTGTSMAAPHVAGVVAQLLDADPTLTPAEVETLLTSTAHRWTDDIDPVDGHPKKGHGLVDAYEALHAVTGSGANVGVQARTLTQDGETTPIDRTSPTVIANDTLTLSGDGLLPDTADDDGGYTGGLNVYQADLVNPFVLSNFATGRDDQVVAAGTTVGISIRAVTGTGGNTADDGLPVTFEVRDSEGTLAFHAQGALECETDSFGEECSASATWQVPPTQHMGGYQASVTVDGSLADEQEITVVGPARGADDAEAAADSLDPGLDHQDPSTGAADPTAVHARIGDDPWRQGTIDPQPDGTFEWSVTLDPTTEYRARLPVEVVVTDGQAHVNETLTLLRPPVPTVDAPSFLPVGEDATFSASADGNVTYEWDLDFDGSSFDAEATGATISASFDEARTRTVAVQATDEQGRTGVAAATVEVAEPKVLVDASGSVAAGVPDEAAAFALSSFGLTGPDAQDADSYWVDLSDEPNATKLTATLSWGFHHRVDLELAGGSASVNANDLDLLFRVPTEDNETAAYESGGGATTSMPEHASFDDPIQGDWRVDVSPYLVAKPDTYDLTVTVWVST